MKRSWLTVIAVLLLSAPAFAQAPYPPNRSLPYRGGVNCVQYADAQGMFNCDPLVTVNPVTHTISSTIASTSGGPLVVGTAASFQALGTDFVIAKSAGTIAPAGPGIGGVTFRVRASTRIPGYCVVTAIAGGAFGVEFPVAFMNPAYPFAVNAASSAGQSLFDQFVIDLPGGPGGC